MSARSDAAKILEQEATIATQAQQISDLGSEVATLISRLAQDADSMSRLLDAVKKLTGIIGSTTERGEGFNGSHPIYAETLLEIQRAHTTSTQPTHG